MNSEPRLRAEDHALWAMWRETALTHARLRSFARHLEAARRSLGEAVAAEPNSCLMWSGGKDSTVLAHLTCVDLGLQMPVYSEKDDLDYPGEREYVERLAQAWGLDLRILTPPISPAGWMAEHAHELMADDDLHSRVAGLSRACFYGLVEQATADHAQILLGLRKDESHGRLLNRVTRGLRYRKASGQWICQPLADWSGLDVMAYLASRGIEPLPVYRCIALMHREEPWRVRKSWWLPGAHTRWGGVVWLRHYWPSLYAQLCRWLPDAGQHG